MVLMAKRPKMLMGYWSICAWLISEMDGISFFQWSKNLDKLVAGRPIDQNLDGTIYRILTLRWALNGINFFFYHALFVDGSVCVGEKKENDFLCGYYIWRKDHRSETSWSSLYTSERITSIIIIAIFMLVTGARTMQPKPVGNQVKICGQVWRSSIGGKLNHIFMSVPFMLCFSRYISANVFVMMLKLCQRIKTHWRSNQASKQQGEYHVTFVLERLVSINKKNHGRMTSKMKISKKKGAASFDKRWLSFFGIALNR